MIKKLLLFLIARRASKQENTKRGQAFAIQGQPVHCQLCRQLIGYPPVRVPLGPPRDPKNDPVYSEDGLCLNPETVYGRFHITCALRYLVLLEASTLEYEPKENLRDESDPG